MSRTKSSGPKPSRPLLAMLALLVLLFGGIAAQVQWTKDAQWQPRLGLDLDGGTQIVLEPVLASGGKLPEGALEESRNVMEQRINGNGVAEAEITTENNTNIVVSIPGSKLSDEQRDLITRSSQLSFRKVLASVPAAPLATGALTPTPSPTKPTGKPTAKATAKPSPTSTQPARPSVRWRQLLPQADPTVPAAPTAPAAPTVPAVPTAPVAPTAPADPAADPQQGALPAGVTPELTKAIQALDCTDTSKLQGNTDDPAKPLVTCSDDRSEKLILGPVEIKGTEISSASAGLQQTQNGGTSNAWEVILNFTSAGSEKFLKTTTELSQNPQQNRFAIVLDGLVISSPTVSTPISGGSASIESPSFNQRTATALSEQLKYGALPLSFTKQTEQQISPLLGAEQLQRGLLAGLIGLLLVVVYSMFQYRALGFVTVSSLAVAGILTYAFVVLLGNGSGLRLTLAGITGLIVSIGVTADSFIVYFERVRDEVRDGRSLRSAVESGWGRARRTILAADAINFLAAVVLYTLASGGVRGFAFTLGLATLIDVIVVMLFTHPLLTVLARTRFFGQGHRLSGLDPQRLGAATVPSIKSHLGTIASRRAATSTPQDA